MGEGTGAGESADTADHPSAADAGRLAIAHPVHEMTELAPPIVTRVAVTLGIGVHIASGTDTRDGLAQATEIPEARLGVPLAGRQDGAMAVGEITN